MKTFVAFILTIITFTLCAQEKVEEIEQFEIRSYSPQKNGVKDLVFEARIDNLTDILQKNLSLGKLTDVSFRIYWMSPSQYQIVVQGLPKGFNELRSDLIQLIKGKLEFILPESFSEKFKSYSLKVEPITDGKLIRAIDQSYNLAVSEFDIVIDKNGALKSIESRAPLSSVKTEFFHSPKAWSNNKLVLDKVELSSQQNGILQKTTNEIDYINQNGIGFPSKITVKNVAEFKTAATEKEKERVIKSETGTVIRFTKYEVNSNKARAFMESAK